MGPDSRVLITKARKIAQKYMLTYGEPIPANQLVREIASVMQVSLSACRSWCGAVRTEFGTIRPVRRYRGFWEVGCWRPPAFRRTTAARKQRAQAPIVTFCRRGKLLLAGPRAQTSAHGRARFRAVSRALLVLFLWREGRQHARRPASRAGRSVGAGQRCSALAGVCSHVSSAGL